jgi:hypothetical protein
MVASAYAGPEKGTYFSSGLTNTTPEVDAYGQVVRPIDSFTKAGEDVANDVQKIETRGSAVNILTATTTTIKSAPGHINHLIAVGGTMGNVTIYDNTAASGTVLFGPATPTAGGVIVADIEFSVGLTVVTAAATAISGSVR